MDAVVVACPHCEKDLRVSDRSKLGKRVKCPGCGEAIVLQEKPRSAGVAAGKAAPAQAMAAQSIPKSLEPVAVTTSDEPGDLQFVFPTTPALPLAERRKRRRRTGLWTTLVILALAGGAGAFIAMNWKPGRPDRDEPPVADDDDDPARADVISVQLPPRLQELEEESELVDAFDLTEGEPIELLMMPSGINGILHLRPRELWSSDVQMQTLRASLTEGVVLWLEEFLQTQCHREPAQIEEVTFGMFLGARGSEPKMAAVVQLAEDTKRSELILEFNGDVVTEREGLRVVEGDEFTYVIKGQRTVAICPSSMAEEIPEWIDIPNLNCSDGLLSLLPHTDRSRLCTLLFDMEAVRRHEEDLFPEDGRLAFQSVLDWFGDEVETVAWSLHVDEENLHSQMYLRSSSITNPARLRETMRNRLVEAPQDLMALARLMDPQRLGFRQMVGRFPAMIEAYRMATVINVGERFIRMTTLLPAKAAPNLALGAMLTWKESTLTDFSAGPTTVASNDEPELTLEERLKLEVDAEFNGEPLEAALAYIGNTIGATIELDGDAFEDAGLTRNMRQTFNLGVVPGDVVLAKICAIDENLVICIDHEADKIRLTTEKFATNQGREIYPLPPAPE